VCICLFCSIFAAPLWYKYPKEFSDCPTKEGFVDLPLDAAAWLIHFKNQNAKHLSNPEVTRHYEICYCSTYTLQ